MNFKISIIFLLKFFLSISCQEAANRTFSTVATRCQRYVRDDCPTESFAGGGKAVPKQFPHMALIGYNIAGNISWKCVGSLINGHYILTTASCVKHHFVNKGPVYASHVSLGELNHKSNDEDAQPHVFNISKIIIHPNFNDSSYYDDIALIQINGWADYNEYIRPACLYDSDTITEKRGIVTGWGKITENGVFEDHLQKIEFDLESDECEELFANQNKLRRGIISEQLCAKPVLTERDVCKGFAGSPLQIVNPNLKCTYHIIGITSTGPACGNGYSSLFTRVSKYIDWIENIVWPGNSNSLIWPF